MSFTHDIALVSCVKGKKLTNAPARDLYTSSLFHKMRSYAQMQAGAWFILSAKYGLLHPDTVIEPYEQTLNTASTIDRKAWAEHVCQQIRSAHLIRPGTTILWLAGRKYMDQLQPMLSGCVHANPMESMRFGQRLSWLNQQLAQ